MDGDTKKLLGKILGEVFRLQTAARVPCSASERTIYGLLNGFENVTDEVLESIGEVTNEQISAVMDALEPYDQDPAKLAGFRGFYDIENTLKHNGVDRGDAMRILTYLRANHQYTDIIARMDTSGSPAECRTFEVDEWSR